MAQKKNEKSPKQFS